MKMKFEDEATCVKDVFQWDDGYKPIQGLLHFNGNKIPSNA